MFEKLCRLCANLKDDLINIFDNTPTMQKIQWQIYYVLHMKIQPNDILPTGICASCVSNLQRTFDFVSYCHNVQKTLKQQYEIYITNNGGSSYGLFHKHSSIATDSNFSSIPYSCDSMMNQRAFRPVSTDTGYFGECFSSCQTESEMNAGDTNQNPSNYERNRLRGENLSKLETPPQEKNNKFGNDEQFAVHAPDLLECSLENENSHGMNQNYTTNDTDYHQSSSSSDEEEPKNSEEKKELSQPSAEASQAGTATDSQKKAFHYFTIEESDSASKKEKEKMACEVCGKTFTQKTTYQEHLNVHTGNRPYVCKICEATFRKHRELKQHTRTIHSTKQFKCSLCAYIAKHKGKLTEHIKSIHEKPFKCSMCSYRTGEKSKIVQHIANKHTTELSFICEICGSGFKTKTSLQNHRQNIHFPQPKVCQTCGVVCPSLSKYSAHIFRCGKDKQRYSCEICGQTYVNKEILKDHMNKHLDVKPYKCEICGKEFFQRNRLDTHKYVHRGPSYHCEVCNQSFNRKDNMKNHIKKHFYGALSSDSTSIAAV